MDLVILLPLIILVVFLLDAARKVLQLLILARSPERMHVAFDDSTGSQAQAAKSKAVRDRVAALEQLGFVALGTTLEPPPLLGRSYREVSLLSD